MAAVIKEGKVRTYDMGGKSTTLEMAQSDRSKNLTRTLDHCNPLTPGE